MDIFNALSVPSRRKIMELLAKEGQMTATAIARKFDISPPAVSQHLKVLREAKLVNMEKRSQQRLYQINLKKMNELEHWARKLSEQWEERFNRLDVLLAQEKNKILNHYK